VKAKRRAEGPTASARWRAASTAPSWLDDMIPLHRHARPEEIVRYLASDMASFVTTATLMADGGLRG
jgi:NAD(P)-dependent dehydrogenase (short-subunit alcohol dehydrogenase family)